MGGHWEENESKGFINEENKGEEIENMGLQSEKIRRKHGMISGKG